MSSGLTRRPLSTPVEAMPRVYTRQVLLYQLLGSLQLPVRASRAR
jgi:hypothetical protein